MERQLIIIAKQKGATDEREFAISEGAEVIFGRGLPELKDDDCLSRQHFVVKFGKNGIRVRHLSQINKTWFSASKTQKARVIDAEFQIEVGQYLYAGSHRFELREIRSTADAEREPDSHLDSWNISVSPSAAMPNAGLPKASAHFQTNHPGTPFPVTESDAYYQARDVRSSVSPVSSDQPAARENPELPKVQLPTPRKPVPVDSSDDLDAYSQAAAERKKVSPEPSNSPQVTPPPSSPGAEVFKTKSQSKPLADGTKESSEIDTSDFDDFDDFEVDDEL